MSVFLPSKDPPEKFKRVVARSGAFSFLESAKSDRLLAYNINIATRNVHEKTLASGANGGPLRVLQS